MRTVKCNIALVGPAKSGKSHFLRVLLRFQPQSKEYKPTLQIKPVTAHFLMFTPDEQMDLEITFYEIPEETAFQLTTETQDLIKRIDANLILAPEAEWARKCPWINHFRTKYETVNKCRNRQLLIRYFPNWNEKLNEEALNSINHLISNIMERDVEVVDEIFEASG